MSSGVPRKLRRAHAPSQHPHVLPSSHPHRQVKRKPQNKVGSRPDPYLPLPGPVLTTSQPPTVWRLPELFLLCPFVLLCQSPRAAQDPQDTLLLWTPPSFGSAAGEVTLPQKHPFLLYFFPWLSAPYEILYVLLIDLSVDCLPQQESPP